ncbi:MAG: TerB N-terminal domain-containing protein [Phycisphaeraceae bacterium]|nr:TerB N-terminal domain-containing protein [Phycisphaeraceae bacterium]
MPSGWVIVLLLVLAAMVVIGVVALAIVRVVDRVTRRVQRLAGPLTGASRGRSSRGRGSGRTPRRPSRSSGSSRSSRGSTPPRSSRAATLQRVLAAMQPRPEMVWHGPDASLRLHELRLDAPLAYVAKDRRASGEPLDPSEIIGSLGVDRRSAARPLAEWGSYAASEPAQRWAYLSWLGAGRLTLPGDPGIVQLHFMGLERRAFADGQDLALVVREVCRVRDLVAAGLADGGGAEPNASRPDHDARRWTSLQRQSGALLWALVALRPDAFAERDLRVLGGRTISWNEEALASALAWFHRRGPGATDAEGGRLAGWMARVLAEQLPGARRSVVVARVPEQFEALFESRFSEKHPAGLVLRAAKRPRTLSYRPANRTLAPVEAGVPDPLGLASQFKWLVELWNACIEDLRGLARSAGGEGVPDSGAMSLAQWEAMPADLRATMDSPFAAALADLAAGHADDAGHAIVAIQDVAAAVRMDIGDRARLTPTQSRALAAAVGEAGMGLEPDARLAGGSYKRDERVVLLGSADDAGGGHIGESESGAGAARYLAASCVLRLGAAVALADGAADDTELAPIAQEIERAFDLSEGEHRRLDALLVLLKADGSSVRAVGKRLATALPEDARRSVARLLVAIAGSDGTVDESERRTLKSAYRVLGCETADLDADLSALAVGDGPAAGTSAAPPPLRLDRDAIARIMAETREVSAILAEAMRGGDDEETADHDSDDQPSGGTPPDVGVAAREPAAVPSAGSIPISEPSIAAAPSASSSPAATGPAGPEGLGRRYHAFYVGLLASPSIPLERAEAMARENRLMLAGAIDAINDWSYEVADGPLLYEDAGKLVVDADRRAMIERRGGTEPRS